MTDRKLLEDARDALKPFAKAGELFVNRDPRLSMQAIYTPAAGDEYNIVSGDLETAATTLSRVEAALAETGEADPMDWVKAIPGQLYIHTDDGLVRGSLGMTSEGAFILAVPVDTQPPALAQTEEEKVEKIAEAIYDANPIEDSGEAIDGFTVSPATKITWTQLQEFDEGIADSYRDQARAAIATMSEVGNNKKMPTADELRAAIRVEWQRFLELNPDDLNSPEDLPNHALITCDQVCDLVARAAIAAMGE